MEAQALANQIMSRNHYYTMVGPDAALKHVLESRKKKKKKKKAVASSSVDSVSPPNPRKGKRPTDDGDWVEQLSKVLCPQERKAMVDSWDNAQASTVEHILIGLNGAIYMSEKIQGLEKSLKEVRAEREGFKAKLGAMAAANKDLERMNRKLQAQLDEERCNSAKRDADLAEKFEMV